MADLRIADAPEIDESEVQGGLKIPTGGFGNKAINMTTVASWVVKDKDLPSKGYVDDKFNQGNQGLAGHVANKNNPHEVTKEQVGLGNVDNTADADKPISNATSAALNLKADKTQLQGLATTTQLNLKADISSVDAIETDLEDSKALFQYDGKYNFDAVYAEKIGGYPLNARLTLSDGSIVQNTVAENKTNPNVDMTGWEKGTRADDVQVGDSTLEVFAKQIKNQELNYNKTVTVGNGGDFTTINAALESLSKDKPIYVFNDDSEYRAEIKILSGYVVNEQININGIDFGFVTITSEDAEVVVNQSALTKKIGRWYSFIRVKNGVIPTISTLFNMNRSGQVLNERVGLYMINSRGFVNENCGIKNAGDRNCDITQCSVLNCGRGIFTGAGVLNFRPATGSTVFMQYADLSDAPIALSCSTGATVGAENIIARNCSNTAVSVQGGVSIDLTNADLSNATQYGLRCTTSSITNASGITINGCQYGVYAENGATVDVQNATINNSTSVGIFASTNATVNAKGAKLYANQVGIISETGAVITATTSATAISNSVQQSLAAQNGGIIIANGANYRRSADTDSATDATVNNFGTIIATGSIGGVSQKSDIQTEKGIIIKGLKTVNGGVITLPAGTQLLTVNHGLGSTPTFVSAEPNGIEGIGKVGWGNPTDATSFTIRATEPLANAILVRWFAICL